MTNPSKERIAAALALAEAVSRYVDTITLKGQCDCDSYELRVAEQAYRATKPKLRSRAEVAEQTLHILQTYLLVSETSDGDCSDVLAGLWLHLEELAGEPTDSGPSSVDTDDGGISHPPASVPVSPAGAAYSRYAEQCSFPGCGKRGPFGACSVRGCPEGLDTPSGPPGVGAKESRDNAAPEGAALEDPEPCGCEETEALRRKLTEIATERSLCLDGFKSCPAALDAIGLILRGA